MVDVLKLVGLGLLGAGGYYLYSSTSGKNQEEKKKGNTQFPLIRGFGAGLIPSSKKDVASGEVPQNVFNLTLEGSQPTSEEPIFYQPSQPQTYTTSSGGGGGSSSRRLTLADYNIRPATKKEVAESEASGSTIKIGLATEKDLSGSTAGENISLIDSYSKKELNYTPAPASDLNYTPAEI